MNKPIVVAEIGINHNSSIDIAKKLIDVASNAGVCYVKFQKRSVRDSTPQDQWDVPKNTPWGTVEPYISYREKMEFSLEQYEQIDSYCKQVGIKWFASAWDIPSVEFLSHWDLDFVKIPSAKLTDDSLVVACAKTFPTILSTGMSTRDEIQRAKFLIQRESPNPYLLHCHSAYPSPDSELNLALILEYKKRWPELYIGFSSHSVSPFPAIYAAAWGAEMIEVHVTLDRAMSGSDHAASLEPHGLQLVVREINRLQEIWGQPEKKVWDSELKARKRLRGK